MAKVEIKKKGKCYSKVNQGQRVSSDMYQTPYSMVMQLLTKYKLDPDKKILEPAKGQGSIVKILRKFGYKKVTAYDIQDTPADIPLVDSKYNFMNEKREFPYIITNPPYRAATEFIQKAATICTQEFIFLMPLNYLHGQKRFEQIYANKKFPFGLSKVSIFTRMPMLTTELRDDGKYNTGMQVYAWYFFVRNHVISPVIDWINNNYYVLRGKRGESK